MGKSQNFPSSQNNLERRYKKELGINRVKSQLCPYKNLDLKFPLPTLRSHISIILPRNLAYLASLKRSSDEISIHIKNSSALLLSLKLWQFENDQNSLFKSGNFSDFLTYFQIWFFLFYLSLTLVNSRYDMLQYLPLGNVLPQMRIHSLAMGSNIISALTNKIK